MEKIIIAQWRIKKSETARILERLAELSQKTRSEPGNLSYAVYQSENDPSELILHECYVNAEAVEVHKNSEHYQRIVVNEIIPHLESREIISVKRLA